MLVDWCYSQTSTDGTFVPLKAISGDYQVWYPAEIIDKATPTTATDVYMAAWSMVYAMGGEKVDQLTTKMPRAFRAYFASCLEANYKVRPDDAFGLLAETDELLERFGEPYYPRRFREFVLPTK